MAKNLKLKMARVEHDMTQGDLADAIGVTRQTIGLIEAGKYNPSLSLCIAICKCLDKTLDQLFGDIFSLSRKTRKRGNVRGTFLARAKELESKGIS